MRMRRGLATLAVATMAGSLIAGCSSGTPAGSGGATEGSGHGPKIGLVTDPGGLNDRSFNALAYRGLQAAARRYGVGTRVLTTTTNADFLPSLTSLARQGYDLVIAVGFQMTSAVDTVAKAFPNTKFAIVDVSHDDLPSKPANVEGVLFRSSQSGFLAGYLAGLYVRRHGGRQVVSSVGGKKIPPVDAYIAGFEAGARRADPGVRTLNDYSQDFTDQAKCKELALNQIQQGSQVVFAVASQCGLGTLSAARQQGVQAIGVDADQANLGPQVLTSALKKVDVAVLDLVAQLRRGAFRAGRTTTYDIASHAVGLGTVSPQGTPFKPQLEAVERQLETGKVTVPDRLG